MAISTTLGYLSSLNDRIIFSKAETFTLYFIEFKWYSAESQKYICISNEYCIHVKNDNTDDTEEESETKNIWKIETVLSWILKFSFVITFMYLILENIYNLFLS